MLEFIENKDKTLILVRSKHRKILFAEIRKNTVKNNFAVSTHKPLNHDQCIEIAHKLDELNKAG